MSSARYLIGDTRDLLDTIPDGSVDLIVTSPPFLALRSYLPADHPDKHREIGSEAAPGDFLSTLLALTVEWRRKLAPHGSLCVELGDTYSGSGGGGGDYLPGFGGSADRQREGNAAHWRAKNAKRADWPLAKSMCGIPTLYTWSLAYGRNLLVPDQTFDPWRIRNLLVWARPNPPVGALGDKFRPATSYVTVACTSPRRWFDLDAVRTPLTDPGADARFKGKSNQRDAARAAGLSSGAGFTAQNAAGAPPLDWLDECDDGPTGDRLWVMPTQPYAGSHFATFPSELPARLVAAMCPLEICRVCGEPRRRIVEAVRTLDGEPADLPMIGTRERAGAVADGIGHWRKGTRRTDCGWSDCGHGSIVCLSCNVLVPYDYAVRRPRTPQGSEPKVGDEDVLAEPVEGESESPDSSGDLRAVRGRVHGTAGSALLHPELFCEAGAPRGTGEHDRTEISPPGSPDNEGRLRPSVGPGGHARETQERTHDGTSGRDAEAHRSTTGAVGDGSPSERREGRQPHQEPGDRDASAPRGHGAVPALRGDVPGQLGGWFCPHCGGRDVKYVADHFRPGLVLDPFAGSGTTLAAATGLGRDALGFDLDPRNAELALDRVGPLLLQVVG